MAVGKKIIWFPDELKFMIDNYKILSNKEILNHINSKRNEQVKLTSLRTKLYEMGYKRCGKPRNWKKYEVKFLLKNYKTIGDTEIAEILNKNKHRTRIFNKKNIEKKKQLLGIKRTTEEITNIRERNRLNGNWKQTKTADAKRFKEGTICVRNTNGRFYKLIKVGDKQIFLHRHIWETKNGPVPDGHKIYFIDSNTFNCQLSNIECRPAGFGKRNIKYKKSTKKVIDRCTDYLQLLDKGFNNILG